MSYEALILADSVSPIGVRLTTFQITFPRFILAEVNTHCMLSRNSASSRAIPVEKRIDSIRRDPFIPDLFGSNKRGMQAGEAVSDSAAIAARHVWRTAARDACISAEELADLNVHKQLANRLIEPFAWHTCIITGTDWRNFFALRCSELAQPEFRTIAEMMQQIYGTSEPKRVSEGEWHLPLVHDIDAAEIVLRYDVKHAATVSAARCARVSYMTHEGKRDIDADLDLAKRLLEAGHMSPFEHVARPAETRDVIEDLRREGLTFSAGDVLIRRERYHIGKLRGWVPLRWTIPGEAVHGGGPP